MSRAPSKPPRLPKLWRKKNKRGQYTGNYICKVNGNELNLGTQILDGDEGAIERSKQAMAGRRMFKTDADRVADTMDRAPALRPASFHPDGPPGMPPAPPDLPPAAAAAPPAINPDEVIPPPPALRALPPMGTDAQEEAAATAAAAAETADQGDAGAGKGDEAPPPEASVDELAELAVGAQVWVAAEYARTKVYRGFVTPELPEQATKQLAAQWKKIVEYSGAAAMLPPWVTGLVIPGAILVTSTFGMARAFAEAAKDQKRQADAPPSPSDIAAAA